MANKLRDITIRKSDLTIIQAFEMALAQLRVYLKPNETLAPFVRIYGNKPDGYVWIETADTNAQVWLHGKSEAGFYVDNVTFTVLSGKKLSPSHVVWMHSLNLEERNLVNVLERYTANRNAIIYRVLGLIYGYSRAEQLLDYLWKYPKVTVDDDQNKEYRLTYEIAAHSECLYKIELWFDEMYGYTQLVINDNIFCECDVQTKEWSVRS